jgi:hypothetical protein
VLRACRRVLKPGGRIAYYNIFISHEAPQDLQRLAIKANRLQYSRAQQTALIRSAGLALLRDEDVTAAYRQTQQALYDANVRHEKELRRAQGDSQFEERQRNRRRTLKAIDAGVLRRSFFVAER